MHSRMVKLYSFVWVLAHTEIWGNEKVDKLAKQALQRETIFEYGF